jgi:signal transduction histidine kinase
MSPTAANGARAAVPSRLLIVEDDLGLARLIARSLVRQGLEVDSAGLGTEALHKAAEGRFDLLLLDYQLPDMTGRELIERLATGGLLSPFIVITGHGDEKLAVEIMKQGARDYLVKDLSFLERLPNVVQQICRQLATELRLEQTEHRLQRSEKNAQALLNATTDAAMLIDGSGAILAANAPLAQRLRRPLDELPGGRFYDFLGADLSAMLKGRIEQAVAGRSMVRFEHAAAGRTFDTSLHPVLDAAGEVVDVAVYSRDITEPRKLAEQLRQAQKMEAIGQLAGGIAHDFNNILQVILGRSDLLAAELPAGTSTAASLREIRQAAERAAALTRQLLAFSRRQVLQPEDLDLNQVIDRLLQMVRRLLDETIVLEFRPGAGLGNVRADAGQMEQVVLNLCINARDAMPDGGRLMLETEDAILDEDYCSAHEGVAPGRYTRLRVSDSGVGMPADVLEHIFEPFFTTKEVGQGTGLGLATVYGIVRQHRGSIHVYSEVGRGTVFNLLFPAVRPAAAASAASVAGAAGAAGAVDPRGTETLLLAEDDAAVRKLAARALEGWGYTVLAAASGDEALAHLRDRGHEVALAVLDVVLPGLDGEALLAELLRIEPDLAVVFTTGYSARAGHLGSIVERGYRIVQKPYGPKDLARRVREALDERKGRSAL